MPALYLISADTNQLENFFVPNRKRGKKPRRFLIKRIRARVKSFLLRFLPAREQLRYLPKVFSGAERYILLALAVIALGSLLALPVSSYYHFTGVRPDYGGTLSEGMVGAPKYINPLLSQASDVDRDLTKLVFAGLMKYDDAGNIASDLAQSYEISPDGLSYTFKLKDDLKWHDGQLLTAEDVVFTILTAQNADYGSAQRINWQGVEINKADDKTVIFKLKNKYAQFLNNTTLGILPKHLWENTKPASFGLSELNIKPVGSGPYKFSKIRRDSSGNISSMQLMANENYHDGKPYISKLMFNFHASEDKMINAFNQNEIKGMSFISPQKLSSVRFLGKLKIKELKLPRYFAVFFNQNQSKVLSDKNVRLALEYATDKKIILEKLLSGRGQVIDSPVLPGIIDITEPTVKHEFNLEKATKILEDAGWKFADSRDIREKAPPPAPKKKTTSKEKEPPPEPTKLEIKLTTSNWPELISVADQLKNQWAKAGVKVMVEILALPELQQAIKDREYESLLFGEVLALDPDPFSFWHSSQKRDPGLNLALYDNKEADKILEEARQTLNRSARLAKYADFQKIVVSDAPVIFLYSPNYLYPQSNKIKANTTQVIAIPSDRFDNINKWYIETKRRFEK